MGCLSSHLALRAGPLFNSDVIARRHLQKMSTMACGAPLRELFKIAIPGS
jgi:hypothetical protein